MMLLFSDFYCKNSGESGRENVLERTLWKPGMVKYLQMSVSSLLEEARIVVAQFPNCATTK